MRTRGVVVDARIIIAPDQAAAITALGSIQSFFASTRYWLVARSGATTRATSAAIMW